VPRRHVAWLPRLAAARGGVPPAAAPMQSEWNSVPSARQVSPPGPPLGSRRVTRLPRPAAGGAQPEPRRAVTWRVHPARRRSFNMVSPSNTPLSLPRSGVLGHMAPGGNSGGPPARPCVTAWPCLAPCHSSEENAQPPTSKIQNPPPPSIATSTTFSIVGVSVVFARSACRHLYLK